MSDALGTYSFLPWLRQGIAGKIKSEDHDTQVTTARTSVHVQLRIVGTPLGGGTERKELVDRDVHLYGPGDVVGLDRQAIVRVEPRDWITNYEPNFVPHVEFYDEDLPWRYTPAAPDSAKLRLRPWLCLVVLAEGEFIDHAGHPLPFIDVTQPTGLPNPNELWAWAHVHVNRTLAGGTEFTSTDMDAVIPRLRAALDENPDLAYSRLICPRRLRPNTPYHAFLVPTFESGRLAGVGDKPSGATHATQSAWQPGGTPRLPVYFRWFFRTGTQGDFEYLVDLLEPRPLDKRVGVRDVDVRNPGSNVPGIRDPVLGGVLKLGGALRVPRSSFDDDELDQVELYENWAHPLLPGNPPQPDPSPHPFQVTLARFVNLADDYDTKAPEAANDATRLPGVVGDPDPLITAPIYGRWHALTPRLLFERDGPSPVEHDRNWVHELNLDPCHRVTAGFATEVVQTNQEDYMQAAWEQIGDVLAANRRIRFAQLALETAAIWYAKQLKPLAAASPERALALTTPAQSHVLAGTTTVRHQRSLSRIPEVLTSAPMRRITRPGGRLMRALPFTTQIRPDNLAGRVNAGATSPAPPKVKPPGIVTTDDVADLGLPKGAPGWVIRLLIRSPWVVWLVLALALLALLAAIVLALAGVPAAVVVVLLLVAILLFALWWLLLRWLARIQATGVIRRPCSQTADPAGNLPNSPDFAITTPGVGAPPPSIGGTDSEAAKRFKLALAQWGKLHRAGCAAESSQPQPGPVSIGGLVDGTVDALDPDRAVPDRTKDIVEIPDRVAAQLDDRDFGEVMAHPELDIPMYQPLKDLSDERLLPNLDLIAQNTITVAETNQRFIESYMVGLNHELGRELLWREYPTDQRGSYFRQFWDPRGALTPPDQSAAQRKEVVRDIPPINRWKRVSELGDHDNREPPGGKDEEVVLIIRGELLKKYPGAVVYAHRARWQPAHGPPDPSKQRQLDEPLPPEGDPRLRDYVRMPMFEARVDPDIAFIGFDLTVDVARGDSGEEANDRPGWFFVIKERPGEPRFGFDLERKGKLQTVNDLTWADTGAPDHGCVGAHALDAVALLPLDEESREKEKQQPDDLQALAAGVSSARWAYLAYQAPVMVAVHATEMLEDPDKRGDGPTA